MKTTRKKNFDAVLESRRWKESVARKTEGMSRAELLEFFNSAHTASARQHGTAEETLILREEPPKPQGPGMPPRLCLEATIPSYLVARPSRDVRLAADQLAAHEWWDERRHDYELFTSQTVLDEAMRDDPAFAAARRVQLAGVTLLSNLPEAAELAKRLLRDEIIPAVATDDATHIALSAHGMEYLLTWNCRHINNHRIRSRIEQACEASGMLCPDICTPAELMSA